MSNRTGIITVINWPRLLSGTGSIFAELFIRQWPFTPQHSTFRTTCQSACLPLGHHDVSLQNSVITTSLYNYSSLFYSPSLVNRLAVGLHGASRGMQAGSLFSWTIRHNEHKNTVLTSALYSCYILVWTWAFRLHKYRVHAWAVVELWFSPSTMHTGREERKGAIEAIMRTRQAPTYRENCPVLIIYGGYNETPCR